jgi:hypothetical protein
MTYPLDIFNIHEQNITSYLTLLLHAVSPCDTNRSTGIILYVYMDDIAVIGPNQEAINSFINSIKSYFKCKILVTNGHVVCHLICNPSLPSLWKVLETWNHVYKHPLTLPLEGWGAEY